MVNAPPAVVWTKKLKVSPVCTEPISASVISVLPERVTETDCGGMISQSGSVHVVAVLLPWTPMPLAYMLRIMRDPSQPVGRRDDMAKAAAPFCHLRLSDR